MTTRRSRQEHAGRGAQRHPDERAEEETRRPDVLPGTEGEDAGGEQDDRADEGERIRRLARLASPLPARVPGRVQRGASHPSRGHPARGPRQLRRAQHRRTHHRAVTQAAEAPPASSRRRTRYDDTAQAERRRERHARGPSTVRDDRDAHPAGRRVHHPARRRAARGPPRRPRARIGQAHRPSSAAREGGAAHVLRRRFSPTARTEAAQGFRGVARGTQGQLRRGRLEAAAQHPQVRDRCWQVRVLAAAGQARDGSPRSFQRWRRRGQPE